MEGTNFVLAILFLFVLPIVLVGVISSHRREMKKLQLKLGDSEASKTQAELANVKSRLEVLEAIVTDKKYQLNSEFEAMGNSNGDLRQ
jgi:Na+-transporting methylmalonyl-CoA/oxaloacetate decarboxylase gamma subunit